MSQKFLRTTAVLLGLAAALPVSAADISWSTGPTFNGPNGHLGILTNGSLVEAINLAGAPGALLTVDPSGLNITSVLLTHRSIPIPGAVLEMVATQI